MTARGAIRRVVAGIVVVLVAVGIVVAATGGDDDQQTAATSGKLGPLVPTMTMVHYSSDYDPTVPEMARVVAEGYKQLGVSVKLEPVDFTTLIGQAIAGKQPEDIGFFGFGGNPERFDPDFWLLNLSACKGQLNYTHLCDRELDRISAKQAQEFNPARRKALVDQAQRRWLEHDLGWWSVVQYESGIVYNSDKWSGVVNPAPVAPHEGLFPWLSMTPLTSDRDLTWLQPEDITTWNILAEEASGGFERLVYDTFLRDRQGKLIPWAARSYKYVSHTKLRVKLRPGMRFHDGRPVTARDAVFTINYLLKWQPPNFAAALEHIKHAEQVDDLTFDIELSKPDPAIPRKSLTYLIILPEHIWSSIPRSAGVKKPVDWNPTKDHAVIGSGPFKFERWVKGEETVLKANKQHWAAPKYDSLVRRNVGSADAARQAMVSGEGDVAQEFALPLPVQKDLADQHSNLKQVVVPTLTNYTVMLNTKETPFDNVAFRKALYAATDRQGVVDEAMLGFGEVAGASDVPIVLKDWYDNSLPKPTFDLDAARNILRKAGFGWDSKGRLHAPAGSGGTE